MKQGNPKSFLGRGIHFPIKADEITGRIVEAEYDDNVKESIELILMTKKGERLMHPDFGCALNEYVFASLDYTTLQMMEREVIQALTLWEPRITDLNVHIEEEENNGEKISIYVDYTVRVTNNMFNMVYPYYLKEGEI